MVQATFSLFNSRSLADFCSISIILTKKEGRICIRKSRNQMQKYLLIFLKTLRVDLMDSHRIDVVLVQL